MKNKKTSMPQVRQDFLKEQKKWLKAISEEEKAKLPRWTKCCLCHHADDTNHGVCKACNPEFLYTKKIKACERSCDRHLCINSHDFAVNEYRLPWEAWPICEYCYDDHVKRQEHRLTVKAFDSLGFRGIDEKHPVLGAYNFYGLLGDKKLHYFWSKREFKVFVKEAHSVLTDMSSEPLPFVNTSKRYFLQILAYEARIRIMHIGSIGVPPSLLPPKDYFKMIVRTIIILRRYHRYYWEPGTGKFYLELWRNTTYKQRQVK